MKCVDQYRDGTNLTKSSSLFFRTILCYCYYHNMIEEVNIILNNRRIKVRELADLVFYYNFNWRIEYEKILRTWASHRSKNWIVRLFVAIFWQVFVAISKTSFPNRGWNLDCTPETKEQTKQRSDKVSSLSKKAKTVFVSRKDNSNCVLGFSCNYFRWLLGRCKNSKLFGKKESAIAFCPQVCDRYGQNSWIVIWIGASFALFTWFVDNLRKSLL